MSCDSEFTGPGYFQNYIVPRSMQELSLAVCVTVHLDYGGNPNATPYTGDAHQFYRPGFGVGSDYTGPTYKQLLIDSGIRRIRVAGKPWFDPNAFGVAQALELYDEAGIQSVVGAADPHNPNNTVDTVARINDLWCRNEPYGPNAGFVPRVPLIECANEPDIFLNDPEWARKTITNCKLILSELARYHELSNVNVIGPSLGFSNNGVALNNAALSAGFDMRQLWTNSHDYTGGLKPSTTTYGVLGEMARGGGWANYVATETGFHSAFGSNKPHPGVNEYVHNTYDLVAILDRFRVGAKLVALYEFLEQWGNSPSNPSQDGEACFGLVRYAGAPKTNFPTFTPKPAYTTLKNFNKIVRDDLPADLTPERILITGPSDVRAFFVKGSDGRRQVWLFRDVSIWDRTTKTQIPITPLEVSVTFQEHSPSTLNIYQPSTSETEIHSSNGVTATFPVDERPICIEKLEPLG
jgi:hypothetical protein